MREGKAGQYPPRQRGLARPTSPRLRVPEEKIYVRLEDMIIIGERKADILTTFVPMDIPGIEALMREDGMLQRYARDGGK
jgi:Xaa-Pro aminopeptidase